MRSNTPSSSRASMRNPAAPQTLAALVAERLAPPPGDRPRAPPPSSRASMLNPAAPQTLAALVTERQAPPPDGRPRAPQQTSAHPADQECITADELAIWMGVNRKTVYEYAARGVIPCRRLGRRLVFSLPAVRAWLARSSGSDPAPLLPVSSRRR